MNDFNIKNGVKITIDGTAKSYHSYEDWGLYIANNDCIGEPVQYTNYVEVPGRDGKIDLSEALSGRPIFTSRAIKIYLAGFRDTTHWDAVMSGFRNNIMGKVCRITFDTDPTYYWLGRVAVNEFKPNKEFGKFLIDIPEADPYKYSLASSAEPWLWDPFNFETDAIIYQPEQEIVGSGTVTVPSGHMLTSPTFIVADIQSATFVMEHKGRTYELTQGSNTLPSVMVGGDTEEEFNFTGTAKVQVLYKGGSL